MIPSSSMLSPQASFHWLKQQGWLLPSLLLCLLMIFGPGLEHLQGSVADTPLRQAQTEIRKEHTRLPVRIRIPSLNIDAPVMPVGLTAENAMAAPRSAYDVGWYAYGARPGEQGNAVMTGHLDTVDERQGVFWNLRNVKPGEIIEVENDDGTVVIFRVSEKKTYPYDRSPLEYIFGTSDSTRLNLITCIGKWDGRVYQERLVVYTEMVSPEVSNIIPLLARQNDGQKPYYFF